MESIIQLVASGRRLVFDASVPASLVAVATDCWHEDPGMRPPAADLVRRLSQVQMSWWERQEKRERESMYVSLCVCLCGVFV